MFLGNGAATFLFCMLHKFTIHVKYVFKKWVQRSSYSVSGQTCSWSCFALCGSNAWVNTRLHYSAVGTKKHKNTKSLLTLDFVDICDYCLVSFYLLGGSFGH